VFNKKTEEIRAIRGRVVACFPMTIDVWGKRRDVTVSTAKNIFLPGCILRAERIL